MRLILQNERGAFEIGGGNHSAARLLEIKGLSPPEKDLETEVCEGGAGDYVKNMRDKSRTITMSLDLYGDENDIYRLYRILSRPLTIRFYLGDVRRKIAAICINETEIESVIYRRLQKVALQFYCANPYFHDFTPKIYAVAQATDMFPNDITSDGKQAINLDVGSIATKKDTVARVKNMGDTIVYPTVAISNNESPLKSGDRLPGDNNNVDNVTGTTVTVTNATTGKSMTIDYTPEQGEKITFDLENRKITSDSKGDITKYITDDTILGDMYFDCGINEITAAIAVSYTLKNTGEAKTHSYDITTVCYIDNNYGAVVI